MRQKNNELLRTEKLSKDFGKLIVIGPNHDCAYSPWAQDTVTLSQNLPHVTLIKLVLLALVPSSQSNHPFSELLHIHPQTRVPDLRPSPAPAP